MLETGDKVGDYTLIKHLGSGSYGVVWLAEKPIQFADKGVLRALKFLSGQNGKGADFESVRREVNTWIEASGHPNVISVIDAFMDSGRFVIVSELAGSGSLRDWLESNDNKAPSPEKAIEMMIGILNGLAYLHSLSITHRDLKPENILLHHEIPRIADFGMSRIVESMTQSHSMAGSPLYMSPEAFRKSKNPQSDIWSAGVIFYEMLSGQFPFYGEDIYTLMDAVRLNEPKPLPPEIPKELRVIVEQALQKDFSSRFQTAIQMRLALNEAFFSLRNQTGKLKETITDDSWQTTNVLDNYSDYFAEGRNYSEKEEYDKAITSYNKAIELNPEDSDVYNSRAAVYLWKGDYDLSINDCNKAIQLDPNDYMPFANLGEAYIEKEDYNKAIEFYNKTLQLAPNFSEDQNRHFVTRFSEACYKRGDKYLNNRNCEQAINDYNKAIELNSEDYTPYYKRGNAYFVKNDYDQAITDFNRAIELNPNYLSSYFFLAHAYQNKDNYDLAIFNYDKVIELNPNISEAYNNRGVVYQAKGNYKQAEMDYIQALKVNPNFQLAKNNLDALRKL